MTAIPTAEQVARAEETLEFVRAHQEDGLWDQSSWLTLSGDPGAYPDLLEAWAHLHSGVSTVSQAIDCGTACCFAGWHAILHNVPIRKNKATNEPQVQIDGEWVDLVAWAANDIGWSGWSWRRAEYFGYLAMPAIFVGNNTIQDLEYWVSVLRYAQEHSLPLDTAKLHVERV